MLPGPSVKEKETQEFKKNWVRSTLNSDLNTENLDFKKSNRASAIIIDKMLIQANAFDGLGAYDLESGKQIWKKNLFNGSEAGPTLDKNLYFGASDGFFYALNPKTGEELWKFKVGAEILSSPSINAEHVYFLSGLNIFYALKIDTGEVDWVYSRPSSSEFSIRGGARPAIGDTQVFVGFSDGYFVSLDRRTGKMKWEVSLNKNKRFKDIDSEVILNDGLLYVSGYDDHLYCLDKTSGNTIWKIKGGSFSGPTFHENLLIYPTSTGEVWGLNKKTSQKLWSYKVTSGIASRVTLFKSNALFGESQGDLILLNSQNGDVLSTFTPGRGIFTAPAVDPKTSKVYFISGEANLYSLTLKESSRSIFDFL